MRTKKTTRDPRFKDTSGSDAPPSKRKKIRRYTNRSSFHNSLTHVRRTSFMYRAGEPEEWDVSQVSDSPEPITRTDVATKKQQKVTGIPERVYVIKCD